MKLLSLLLASVPVVLAFSDTHPVLGWSSHSASPLHPLVHDVGVHDSVCDVDAVILIDHPGLHASDLRRLPSSSALASALDSAPSSFQSPYVKRAIDYPFSRVAASIFSQCGFQRTTSALGELSSTPFDRNAKHIISISMPRLPSSSRQSSMTEHDSRLASDLDAVSFAFPNYIILYAGWEPSPNVARMARRQEHSGDIVLPEGGILHRYQLLTPGLISSLLVTLFILLPAIFFGVTALASIRSPLRGEAAQGFNASERKNQ